MAFRIEYFHQRVLREIESWPVDVLADYARITELLGEHGPDLRLPGIEVGAQAHEGGFAWLS